MLIELGGTDALSWLQGQTTNDMRAVSDTRVLKTCMCDPQGRITALLNVFLLEGNLCLSGESASLIELKTRFDRTVIIEDVTLTETGLHLTASFDATGGGVANVRFGRPCFDSFSTQFKGNSMSQELTDLIEIESLTPRFGFEIDSKTFIPELGAEFEAAHISYNKGCYTGQEVLMRLRSRGHTNRTLRQLTFTELVASNTMLPNGTKVTRCATGPSGVVAMGFVRN